MKIIRSMIIALFWCANPANLYAIDRKLVDDSTLTQENIFTCLNWADNSKNSTSNKDVLVSNSSIAIAIAQIYWSAKYGEKTVSVEQPFIARDLGNYWFISSTLPEKKGFITVGGAMELLISKGDGAVKCILKGK